MASKPPGERAEPEDGAVQQGKALSEGVAAGNVRDFVSDNGVELGVVPLAPGGGQQNGGAQRTHRNRNGNQFGFGGLRDGDKAPCGCARGESLSQAGIVNWLRSLQQSPAERKAHEESREQNQSDGEIDSGCDNA